MTSTTEPSRPEALERRVETLGGLDIAYDGRVLRPRAWTAAQSEWAADLLAVAPDGPVLELCTGAGHIGLLAIHGSARRLVAVDADPIACDYAGANAAANSMAIAANARRKNAAGVMDAARAASARSAEAVGADRSAVMGGIADCDRC